MPHNRNTYQLFVRDGDDWIHISDITADTHRGAFRKAMVRLKPEHYDKQIRLEQKSSVETSPNPAKRKSARKNGRR